jgi:2-polyprenyl-6-methoxyphenol hydroxylase-like FAD-dependent oxidoreductase
VPRILITGASVAGPALAFWLGRAGWDVTLLERADELRDEGQNVDVRDAGREAAVWMGIEDAIREHTTGEVGTVFVDRDGGEVAAFGDRGDATPTAELEILRGDLARIVVERLADAVEVRFGDHVEEVVDDGDGVRVRLASGAEETYDVLAVAEGARSRTRELVLGPTERRFLGADIAYLTIPRRDDDTDWWRWYNATDGRSVSLRPDPKGTIRAMLTFMTEPGADELGRDEQVARLRERFAGAGWQTQRILDALDDAPMYYESLAQVRAPSWSRGRVVLLGDAAHAPTPMAGFGASMALIDGYVLAGELVRSPDDPESAFARYEETLRGLADDVQDLPPGTPGLMHPRTELGVRLLHLGQKVAAGPIGRVAMKVLPSGRSGFDLPALGLPGERPGR